MKLEFVLPAIIAFVMIGCSSEEVLYEPDSMNKKNDHSVSLSEALNVADGMMMEISQNSTRTLRVVSSVEYKLSEKTTRANGADTLLYLVNYSDNQGFALLSADKRLPAIYAISDEGHFEFKDTLENAGLRLFMQSVDERINKTFSNAANNNNSVVVGPINPWNKDYYKNFRSRYYVITPKLTQPMSRLGQNAPFDKSCIMNGKKRATGCAPIAFVSLMSYYKWPTSIEGYQLNWDEIREGNDNESIARIISYLWKPEYLNVHPVDETGTGAYEFRYIPTLEKLGYENPGNMKTFECEDAYAILDKGSVNGLKVGTPLLVRGETLVDPERDGYSGHLWVIDGAMKQHPLTLDYVHPGGSGELDYSIPLYMFHCVWNWYGNSNGFFNFDSNTIGGLPDAYGEFDEEVSKSSYVFTQNINFFGNLNKRQ
ncbi:MAG: C10 family peptidase [Prevotella sp.]|nr:C10 family peptidase [Bacteroides sp.]MCM1366204.1 C10 family peptidase [Prevotella sp.]MCM1436956.1 C10 family peptidase [Prevotella sp.]